MKPDKKNQSKLWGGRFTEKTSSIMERIGESVSFDKRLYREDIQGSISHARGLERIGVLNQKELSLIENALREILNEIEAGNFQFDSSLEDIHMNIESRLTQLIGDAGKKLHTGRSRNDQVSQDVRLFILREISEIQTSMVKLLESIVQKAEDSVEIVMPGYTHLQVAQPIRASHYLLAYFFMFRRDFLQFEFAKEVSNILVLGSGALAGVNYPTDREFLKEDLFLHGLSENSMDAVSNRDHILNVLFASSQCMVHLSRLSEDLILYSSQEFSFIRLPDSLTTGSSIMPQKKNPDIAELIRGKSARVIGSLNSLFILLKGLPMAYNRDLQEDKISLFDSLDQMKISIEGMTEMIRSFSFLPENMEASLKKGHATATDLADFLVKDKKVPFREAHELVGKLVSACVENKTNLFDIDLEQRKKVSEFFASEEYFDAISLYNSCDKKDVYGGTAKLRQLEQISLAKELMIQAKNAIQGKG